MVVRVIVHEVRGVSQHKVKNKHGNDKANYDYPTGGLDAFKRGGFLLNSFHDEKIKWVCIKLIFKIKRMDTVLPFTA